MAKEFTFYHTHFDGILSSDSTTENIIANLLEEKFSNEFMKLEDNPYKSRFYNDLLFLSLYITRSTYRVVYLGGAKSIYIPLLCDLFPSLTFDVWDVENINYKVHERMTFNKGTFDMTKHTVTYLPKDCLFISRIPVNQQNLAIQKDIISTLNPIASCIKFFPLEEDFLYFTGSPFFLPYRKTENTMLFLDSYILRKWDKDFYMEQIKKWKMIGNFIYPSVTMLFKEEMDYSKAYAIEAGMRYCLTCNKDGPVAEKLVGGLLELVNSLAPKTPEPVPKDVPIVKVAQETQREALTDRNINIIYKNKFPGFQLDDYTADLDKLKDDITNVLFFADKEGKITVNKKSKPLLSYNKTDNKGTPIYPQLKELVRRVNNEFKTKFNNVRIDFLTKNKLRAAKHGHSQLFILLLGGSRKIIVNSPNESNTYQLNDGDILHIDHPGLREWTRQTLEAEGSRPSVQISFSHKAG